MTAHTKDALGTYAQPADRRHEPAPSPPAGVPGTIRDVPLLGRIVHIAPTTEGPRAISKNALVKPDAVERYLRGKFGSQLCAALSAMERLAATMSTDTLNDEAIRLYEIFRPDVPSGKPGWDAKGVLDLDLSTHSCAGSANKSSNDRDISTRQAGNRGQRASFGDRVGTRQVRDVPKRGGDQEYYARLKREERVEVKLSGHSAR